MLGLSLSHSLFLSLSLPLSIYIYLTNYLSLFQPLSSQLFVCLLNPLCPSFEFKLTLKKEREFGKVRYRLHRYFLLPPFRVSVDFIS